MRPLRLTIFLWILLALTIITLLPNVFPFLVQLLSGDLDLSDSATSLVLFLVLSTSFFSIFLIVMMFKQKIWARNFYLIITGFSCLRGLLIGEIVSSVITIVVLIFVFYKSWDDFY
jgi:hypothetical protein